MKPFFLRATGLALMLLTFFSCNKDNWVVEDSTTPAFQSITIDEARRSFESRLSNFGSLDDSDKQFIDLKPQWDRAALGHAQSGREIIIVPLSDRRIDSLNHGRADAKLQFVKLAGDSILIDVVLYCADSSYAAGHLSGFSYADFTGAVISYNLLFDVQWGVYVEHGQAVARLDSVSQRQVTNGEQTASTRGDGGTTLICNSHVSVWRECGSISSQACWYEVNYWFECHEIGSDDPNSGGGGSSSGGGSWGPGNNGNPNNGEPDIPFPTHPELDCSTPQYYWACLYYDAIATHLFGDTPNAPEVPLPYGFDEALFNNLLDIIAEYKLDKLAAQWLITHRDLIDEIHSQLPTGNEPTPTSPDPDDPSPEVPVDMKELIEFCAEVGLNQEQWRYLLENPGSLAEMNELFPANNKDETSKRAIRIAIDLADAGQVPIQPNSPEYQVIIQKYPEIAAGEEWPIGFAFALAVHMEACKLKLQHPDWSDFRLTTQATKIVIRDNIHILLDIGGLVPGIGEICDISNGVIYTFEGDYLNAGFSYTAAAPVVGWYSIGAKYCTKAITNAGGLSKLAWKVDPGTGKVLFAINDNASRKQLSRILATPFGFQAHHLIPLEFKNNNLVQLAAKRDGPSPWHMNYVDNGINLSNARHNGSHTNYSNAVAAKLVQIENNLGANPTPDQAYNALKSLAGKVKGIFDNNPNLHVNDPQLAFLIGQLSVP